MKKIKLMLVAFMAMIGVNAMAQTNATIGIWKISYADVNSGVIVGFKNDAAAADIKNLVIPTTLVDATNGNKEVKIITVGDGTNALSTATLLGSIETIDATSANLVTINDNAFKGETGLKSITVGGAVTTIGASAFDGCTKLKTVDLSAAAKLATIKSAAFAGTPSLKTISFEDCDKMVDFGTFTPFVSGTSTSHNYLVSVTLNENTTNIGTAFANIPNLAILNVDETKLASLKALALNGNTGLTELELPATCLSVENTALQGTKVADLTINSNQEGTTQTIGGTAGAIYGTSTAILTDLTFVGEFKGTVTAYAFPGMTKLTTVEFAKISGTIKTGAIGSKVTSLTIGDITGTIEAGAIVLDAANSSTVEVGNLAPAAAANLAAGAITGPTTAGKFAELTVGNITKSINGLISNNVSAATVGIIGDGTNVVAVPVTSFGNPVSLTFGEIKASASLGAGPTASVALTSLTFNGAIAGSVGAGAFSFATKLATVAVNGLAVDGAFAAASFYDATGPTYAGSAVAVTAPETIKLNVTYNVTGIAAANDAPFALTAFAATGYTGTSDVKLTTIAAVETAETGLQRVVFGVAPATANIKVYSNNATTYYGKFICPAATNYEIEKADVAGVYSAYVDGSKIYMDPLRVVDGKYVVAGGQAVVVKTTSADEVVATSTDDAHTMRVKAATGYPIDNNIVGLTVATEAYTILDANVGDVVYAIASIAQYGLLWKTFESDVTLPKNTLYVVAEPTEEGRLQVIWLDGSEDEATAIQGVKNVAEDGAIYNLAGQKVSASYKGVVIKNGKKMIQK